MTYGDGQTFDGMGTIVDGELSRTGKNYRQRIAELEAANAGLRQQLDGVGIDRMEAAQHRDELATLKGELAACEQCHERLEAEIAEFQEGYQQRCEDIVHLQIELEAACKNWTAGRETVKELRKENGELRDEIKRLEGEA